MRLLRPFASADTYRTLAFLLLAAPFAAVLLGLFIAGWTAILVLAITPLVIFLLVGYRGAVGIAARVDAVLARLAARRRRSRRRSRPAAAGSGVAARRCSSTASFWRQQVYLALRMTLGFAIARRHGRADRRRAAGDRLSDHLPLVERGNIGSWHADTLGRALLFLPAGVVVLLVAVHLLGPLATLWRRLASSLLRAPEPRARRAGLARHAVGGRSSSTPSSRPRSSGS